MWREHPTTRIFWEVMEKWINEWARDWTDGKFLYNQIDNAKAIGAVETLRKLRELTPLEVTEVIEDDE